MTPEQIADKWRDIYFDCDDDRTMMEVILSAIQESRAEDEKRIRELEQELSDVYKHIRDNDNS